MENKHGPQLTGFGKKVNRRELDFYPTPWEATEALVVFLTGKGLLKTSDTILEPACGDGAISKVIESHGFFVDSADIREVDRWEGAGVIFPYTDYLKNPFTWYNWIITNPPFNLSVPFIEKALRNASNVAMLLKSQYWHSKNRLQLFRDNPPSYVLPLTWRPDFIGGEKGGSPTMEVHWTVWCKGDTTTKYVPLEKPSRKEK